jgi:hypothetical protein
MTWFPSWCPWEAGLALLLTLAACGAGLFLKWPSRSPAAKVARGVLWGAAALCAAGLFLLSLQTILWDGGFRPCEAEFTFLDRGGAPVEGVELQVETQTGTRVYYYPVTDYLPDRVPRSDARGTLVFHHAVSRGMEFGGKCHCLLGLVEVGPCDSPRYSCRFFKGEQEVHRCSFNELQRETSRTVTRQWRWPVWPYEQFLSAGGDGREFAERCGYGRVPMDRPLAIAWQIAFADGERASWSRNEPTEKERDPPEALTFYLAQRTVIVPPAPDP